jgi:ElaB/YqjD/DUF883 family membrane-anchored ribosome-binding protein
MSGGIIGGNLSSLDAQSSTFDRSAGASEETSESAQRLAAEMETGLAEVSELLRSAFAQTAEEYDQIARDTQAQLDSTEWTGSRKERAVAAGQDLTTSINQVNASQNDRVGMFKDGVINMAQEMVEDMRAQYGDALARARESFDMLQQDTTQMREGLEQIDSGGMR